MFNATAGWRKVTCAALATVVLLLTTLPGWANDTAVGGDGASFGPMTEERAAMRSEHIRIRLEDDGFHVHATYRLVNMTDEPLTLRIGFPEADCIEDSSCRYEMRDGFAEMQTTVRGVLVPPVVEETGAESAWAYRYPRIWTFEVNFEALEDVSVVHTYRVVPSIDIMEVLSMKYVVVTGANWGAPIESAEFELDLPSGTCAAEVRGAEATFVRDADTGRWVGRWSRSNWVPTEDFEIAVFSWEACAWNMECPGSPITEYIRNWTTDVPAVAAAFSPTHLRLCRNLAWAVTGYRFRSEDLTSHFYDTPEHGLPRYAARYSLPHAVDPDWGFERLNEKMRIYARIIRRAEDLQQAVRRITLHVAY